MPARHALLAVAVVVLWGVNFLAIHASLDQFPPLFLVALRFAVIAVPTVLLVPRPDVEWRWLIGYGLGFGTVQFFGLYLGMAAGYPAGLASLVLQSSAPFTVLLGAVLIGERVSLRRGIGVAIAVGGLVIVGLVRAGHTTLWPFLLVLLGGLGWALGNLASRRAASSQPLRMVLWMSVVPPVPMLFLSVLIEGPEQISTALATSLMPSALPGWLGLGYTVLAGTLLGSGIWVWLMGRHPASVVAPFSLLVPVVGLSTAWVVLHERPLPGEFLGAAVVVLGVALSSWPPRKRDIPTARGDREGVGTRT